MPAIGKTPPDRLQIANSPIRQQPVQPVAMYSGELSDGTLDEFKRRYGPTDYVVIETRGKDGTPVGRVYSWPDDAGAGPNPALQAVTPGTSATVTGAYGKIRFQGQIRAVHDFIQSEVLGEWPSPDKTRKALLQKAGWSQANLLSVVDLATGTEKRLRALGIEGYRYLEVRWLSSDVLFEAEGNGTEVGLYTIDLRKTIPTAVLLDGSAAARDMREAGVPIRDGDGAVTLTGYNCAGDILYYDLSANMKDQSVSQLRWQATLSATADGSYRLTERRPQEAAVTAPGR